MNILENEKKNLAEAVLKRDTAGQKIVNGTGGAQALVDFEQSETLICMIESSIAKIEAL